MYHAELTHPQGARYILTAETPSDLARKISYRKETKSPMRDVGNRGELDETGLVHDRDKRQPNDPCGGRFEPNRRIENFREQFIVHARYTPLLKRYSTISATDSTVPHATKTSSSPNCRRYFLTSR